MIREEESIKALTGRLMRIINKHSRIEELPIHAGMTPGLTAKEVHCIQVIGQQEGINIKGIGDTLGVTRSAASQMVGKLNRKSFVKKKRALDNDKEVLVCLTGAGWQAFRAHKEFHERHLKTLMQRLADYPDTQLAIASVILSVVETVVDERMAELFGE